MSISIIAAVAKNSVIGKNGNLPWHYPQDLEYFKRITYGKTVVMGRKTAESLGTPLPGRQNIVLTKGIVLYDLGDGFQVINDLDIINVISERQDVFIIGGAEIFKLFLPNANKLYLTEIHSRYEGDAVFPEWDKTQYKLIKSDKQEEYDFNVYEKI